MSDAAGSGLAIEVAGLTKRFGEFAAVDDVARRVPSGTIFAFLGANGSGKTTTIRMLIGLLAPTAGTITVAGVDVIAKPRRVREAIGYMGQKVSLYRGLTLYENVEFYAGLHDISGKRLASRWGALRERFDLADSETSLSEDLPAGLRQRAGLALAMLHSPRLLFLDEPTAGVDVGSRALFWELIREQKAAGVTVFVTTHFLDEVDHCDLVSFIDAGRIVTDSTPEGLRAEWSDGYEVTLPLASGADAASAVLSAAGWAVAREAGGLRLRAPVATTAMLAAVRRAAGAAGTAGVEVKQPGMGEVFGRLIDRGRAVREEAA